MTQRYISMVVIVFGFAWLALPAAHGASVTSSFSNTVRGLNAYLKGVQAIKKRDYAKGTALLIQAVHAHPGAKWQDGAHFWLGHACVAHDNPKRDIEKSRVYFRSLLKQFPESAHRWNAENYLKLIEEVLQPRREVQRIKEELLKE